MILITVARSRLLR